MSFGRSTGFSPPEIDLGDQLWGQVIPFQLVFENHTESPLTVADVKSSCGCTVLDKSRYEGAEIPPGGHLLIEAAMNTESDPGAKTRTVDLLMATGVEYTAPIRINVYGTWSLTPDTVDFGRVVIDDTPEPLSNLVVFESSLEDHITGVHDGGQPWLSVRWAKRDGTRHDILLSLIREQLPPGVSTASLVVETTNPIKSAAVIYVRAKGVYSLNASHNQVFLVGSGSKRVKFTNEVGRPAKLMACSVQAAEIVAAISGPGEVILSNPSGVELDHGVPVIVVDEQGRKRSVLVFTFSSERSLP